MNWDDLKVLLAVARCGTMTGAAKQLNVQHSTISRRIRALEDKLGASLLTKKQGHFVLTSAGVEVIKAASRIESEIVSFDGSVFGKDEQLSGPLNVTTFGDLASTLLMPMFSSFCEAHPQIDLHILVSNSTISLAQREADVAIRMSNSPTDTLIGKRIATVATAIYGSTPYINRQKEESSKIKWLGVDCCGFHKNWTKQTSGSDTHQFNCDDSVITAAAIREGLGVSFLPCFIGDADPLLERYSQPNPDHDLGLWILMHPELKRNARVIAFRTHAIQFLENKKNLLQGQLKSK